MKAAEDLVSILGDNSGVRIFLFRHKTPCQGAFNEYPQYMFYGEHETIILDLSSNTNSY